MNIIESAISKTGQRIRLLRGLRGLFVGAFVGALVCLAWVVLDVMGLWLTEWTWLLAVMGTVSVVGAVGGWSYPLRAEQIARSLDTRADLQDRATAALEVAGKTGDVAAAIQEDAALHLGKLDVSQAYPVRLGPWPGMAIGCAVVASLLFWLVNSGVLLNPQQKTAKKQMESVAGQIERIAKPLSEKSALVEPGKEEKDLAKNMVDMAKKLERGRLNEEAAMRKAEELTKQAQDLAAKRFDESQEKMMSWQDQMAKTELAKAGIDQQKLEELNLTPEQLAMMQAMQEKAGVNPGQQSNTDQRMDPSMMDAMNMSDSAKEMMKMTSQERKALSEQLKSEMEAIQEELKNPNLSAEEKKALEERMKQLQELMKDIKFSEDVYQAMKDLMETETYKELQKMMAEMAKMSDQVKSGEKLSEEDMEAMKEKLKEMQKNLEEWAKKMKDPEFRKQIEDEMKEMLEAMKRGELTFQQCQNCMGLFGMNGLMQLPGGSGGGGMSLGDGENRKQDRTEELEGKTLPLGVRGERDDKRGEESYQEIKAPTSVGTRTSVPYTQVLPKYKTSAEKAMGDRRIPKKHEGRVREYFESLGAGGSDRAPAKAPAKSGSSR